MNKHVWVSECRSDPTLIKLLTSDIAENRFDIAVEAGVRMLRGMTVPPDWLPKILWAEPKAGSLDKLPHFFVGNGYWIVYRKAADIISCFDLGEGGLYPVEIFKKDKKTPVDGEFLCLNVGAQKSAFLPELSPRSFKQPNLEVWSLPDRDKDEAFFLSDSALEGADLWWDPRVRSGFFLSAPLGDALKKAGMARAFRLYRCPIVGS